MSSLKTVKVIDWQTKEQQKLPRFGQGSYMRLLIEQGYDIVSTQMLGNAEIEIYRTSIGSIYAVYHPFFGTLDTECLFVNIPSESVVQMLISNSIETLEPIKQMFGL
jgi:hypothetical protein